jgi:glycogen phosphorylase
MEASGTGNMKLMMNGAVTMATFDGANIEILDEVGDENIYVFGLRVEQVEQMKRDGSYNPRAIYESDPKIKRVFDAFLSDRFSPQEPGLFRWIFDELINRGDRFFHLADLPQYVDVNREVDADFRDLAKWRRMSILNTARSPYFSSDRTIREYAKEIWKIKGYGPKGVIGEPADLVTDAPLTGSDLHQELGAD